MDMKKIGIRLCRIRKALGLTAAEVLGEGAKLPNKRIYRIENGLMRINIVDMIELCNVYDVSIDSVVFSSEKHFEELISDLEGVKYEVRDDGE